MASEEYNKLVQLCPKLRVAFQDHLIILSEDLQAAGMISDDGKTEVLNQSVPLPNRASKLVDLITNRVKLMRENYRTFVELLRRRKRDGGYKAILVIRKFLTCVTTNTCHVSPCHACDRR